MAGRFDTTQWSVVLAARLRDEPAAEQALERLCQDYWPPLYGFVRGQGYDAERARDLTQAYFLRLLEKDYLRDVDRRAGRFRAFLLASMKHFLANEAKARRALKRGGGQRLLSLEFDDEESRLRFEPADRETPEALYAKRWARLIIRRTQEALRREFAARDRVELFDRLSPFLTDGKNDRSYAKIAEELERSEASLRMTVHRMRRRFGELVRSEVARTVADPEDTDAEIRVLFEALQGDAGG